MDIVLEVFDTFLFDRLWERLHLLYMLIYMKSGVFHQFLRAFGGLTALHATMDRLDGTFDVEINLCECS